MEEGAGDRIGVGRFEGLGEMPHSYRTSLYEVSTGSAGYAISTVEPQGDVPMGAKQSQKPQTQIHRNEKEIDRA